MAISKSSLIDKRNLAKLLEAGHLENQNYLSRSPFWGAGISILEGLRNEPHEYETNAQAFGIPFLKGIIGQGLSSYGISKANDLAYADYSKSPLLKEAYTEAERPSGWSMNTGKMDLDIAVAEREAERKAEEKLALQAQKEEAAKEKDKARIAQALAAQGLRPKYDEAGNQIGVEVDQEMLAAKNEVLAEQEKIKGKYNPNAAKAALGINPKLSSEIADTRSIIDSTENLIKKIEVLKPTWTQIFGGKIFAGLDDTGTARDIRNLSEMVKVNVTGAAYQKDQGENLDRMVAGDPTMTVDEIKDTLKYFADFQKRRVNSKMDTASQIASGTLKPYELEDIVVNPSPSVSAGPGSAPVAAPIPGGSGSGIQSTGQKIKGTNYEVVIVNGVEGIIKKQ